MKVNLVKVAGMAATVIGTAATLINYVKLPPYGLNVYKKTGLGGGIPEPDMSPKSTENNKRGNSFLDSK